MLATWWANIELNNGSNGINVGLIIIKEVK